MTSIASTAAPKIGTSTTLKNLRMTSFTVLILPSVALVPPMGSFASFGPNRDFQLVSRILLHMETRDKIAGMQQPAASNVAVPKVNLFGAGII
jgi:hypothetical protein